MTAQRRILIQFAHARVRQSRVNRIMIDAVRGLEGVIVNDLYELYPDFFIDVKREQKLLSSSDLILFQHPLQWYSSPAIIKEWQDVVLEHGFAYGEGGNAVAGKDFMLVLSTGGSRDAYTPEGAHQHELNELLQPFVQTARLCQLNYLAPIVLHSAHSQSLQEIESHAQAYRDLLECYLARGNLGADRSHPESAKNQFIGAGGEF